MTAQFTTTTSTAIGRSQLLPYPRKALAQTAQIVARDLLGRVLVRRLEDGTRLIGRIVETEAYLGAEDPASHAYGGRLTNRTRTLFRAGGCWYVYFIYGMHHCINVVSHTEGSGHAVLIRAVEIIDGADRATVHRAVAKPEAPGALGGGPGKLCQALAIDKSFDGRSVLEEELLLARGRQVDDAQVAVGPRVGIDYAGEAVHWPLRYAISGHRDVSRPRL